ncbi:hypothetical protein LCGC14_2141760 [marine sediment metagenome]|uniref:Uncharacterized protein n=1 Tax=marine sediment metagenome TaxID=412755 RepID=A0A0F9DY64_9ZZZZ
MNNKSNEPARIALLIGAVWLYHILFVYLYPSALNIWLSGGMAWLLIARVYRYYLNCKDERK